MTSAGKTQRAGRGAVIVLGGGGAGLAAAVAAAEAGADVLLLEQSEALGGTTKLAVGSITAAGTRLQARRGIVDDPEDFHHDMDEFTADLLPYDNPALRRLLAREAAVTVDWLEDQGVVFVGPFDEPPHRRPRMHNAVPGASSVVRILERRARQLGVRIVCRVRAIQWIRDAVGVAGVNYVSEGDGVSVRADGAIVLATGDFSGNAEWRARWLPEAAAKAAPINPRNQGGGHQLALELGAQERNMTHIFGPQLRFPRSPQASWVDNLPDWRWLTGLGARLLERGPAWALRRLAKPLLIANMSPSPELFEAGAILIDVHGHRLDTTKPAESVAHSTGNKAYIVLDAQLASRFSQAPHAVSTAPGIAYAYVPDYVRARPDIAATVSDLEALAARLSIPVDALAKTAGGGERGPWTVLGPVHAMITTTEGSLAVDTQLRVLGTNERPIPGLYAAGCIGQGGLLLRGHGLHWAWTFTSGRLAGRAAAEQARLAAFTHL